MRSGNVNNKENNQKQNIKERKVQDRETKTNNKFKVVLLIVICVCLVLATALALIHKYNNSININKTQVEQNEVETETGIIGDSKDSKYLVEFSDTYTYNPITINNVQYSDGKIKINGVSQDKVSVSYVQISGMLDTNVQEKINSEIKQAVFSLNKNLTSNQQYGAFASVEGNFANILSVQVAAYVYENDQAIKEQEYFLNYNLATGEKIKFLDLFADNTPMNSIVYDLKYKELAWDTRLDMEMSEIEWYEAMDMDNRDTSKYEDIIFQSINRYKKLNKDEIDFFITPNRIVVYLGINEGGEVGRYVIDLYRYADYITLFKKFLTDKVIYENIPTTKALVFNDYLGYIPVYYQTENLFLCMLNGLHFEYEQEVEQEEIKNHSSEAVSMKKKVLKEVQENIEKEVKNIANKNTKKGYVARFMPFANIDEYSNEYGKEAIICVSFYGELEEMSKEYFDLNLYKLLAKQNAAPKVSIDDALVGALDYNNKNIKRILYDENSKAIFDLTAYYTLDGKLVANTYEEVQQYIDSKYKGAQQLEGIEIYKEENI